MKTKKNLQKLTLNKITVINLNGLQLENARGGQEAPPNTEEGECITNVTVSFNCTYLLDCTWTCATEFINSCNGTLGVVCHSRTN